MSDIIFIQPKTEGRGFEQKANAILYAIRDLALKAGRSAARPLLCAYYVMTEGDLSSAEKLKVYAALAYILLRGDIIPAKVFHLLGMTDDLVAGVYIFKKISSKVTPNLKLKVERKLDEWFGYEIHKV